MVLGHDSIYLNLELGFGLDHMMSIIDGSIENMNRVIDHDIRVSVSLENDIV